VASLVSGCGRLHNGGNAENFDDTSGVVTHTPLSSEPANLPVPTLPTPNPTTTSKPDLDHIDELCGQGNVAPYYIHSVLSFFVNAALISMPCSYCVSNFLGILRMFSVFSFPVHAYLTNPSFLSKSKISLASLAADTWLSLCWLITKNPSMRFYNTDGTDGIAFKTQYILELAQLFTYPYISAVFSHCHDVLKFMLWICYDVSKGAI
jgi:hypothetical protein